MDLFTAPRLAEELGRAQRERVDVIVDLEKVEFMDCAALRVLARATTASGPGNLAVGSPRARRRCKSCSG